jgi:putative transposase
LEFEGGVISGLFEQPVPALESGGDHAMTTDSTTTVDYATLFLGEAWSDPIEAGIRDRIRDFIEELIEEELAAALGRGRYERRHRRGCGEAGLADGPPATATGDVAAREGHRHGHRRRRMIGSFGTVELAVPRARVGTADGGTAEWKSRTLPRYARMTRQVEALIAGTYLAGTNTRRVRRALAALFRGAIGKDTVSRIWRKVKTDWEAWSKRPLGEEDIVRLILDGTVVRVRLDKKATSISLLVVLGVRRDGQKVLLAVKNMGGESEAAWRALLDDLVARGLKTPEFLIVDGAAGLEKALAALWPELPTQRCTVHKHRNLLAHAPEPLHEEVSADYTDMIYAATPKEVEERRKAFLRKWRLKCRAVAECQYRMNSP